MSTEPHGCAAAGSAPPRPNADATATAPPPPGVAPAIAQRAETILYWAMAMAGGRIGRAELRPNLPPRLFAAVCRLADDLAVEGDR